MKCSKCGTFHKNKMTDYPELNLCFNCEVVWKMLGVFVKSIDLSYKINRDVQIHIDGVKITKRQNGNRH